MRPAFFRERAFGKDRFASRSAAFYMESRCRDRDASEPIETRRPRSLQPLHVVTQVWLRRFHGQMEMIAHHDERMQPPAKCCAGFQQAPLERHRRSLAREQIASVIAAIDDVVTGPGKFQSQLARHDVNASRRAPALNPPRTPNHGTSFSPAAAFTIHVMTLCPSAQPAARAAVVETARPVVGRRQHHRRSLGGGLRACFRPAGEFGRPAGGQRIDIVREAKQHPRQQRRDRVGITATPLRGNCSSPCRADRRWRGR